MIHRFVQFNFFIFTLALPLHSNAVVNICIENGNKVYRSSPCKNNATPKASYRSKTAVTSNSSRVNALIQIQNSASKLQAIPPKTLGRIYSNTSSSQSMLSANQAYSNSSLNGTILGGNLNGTIWPDRNGGMIIGGPLSGSIMPGNEGGMIIGGPASGTIFPGESGGMIIGGSLSGSIMPGNEGGMIIGGPFNGSIVSPR